MANDIITLKECSEKYNKSYHTLKGWTKNNNDFINCIFKRGKFWMVRVPDFERFYFGKA